MSEGNHFYSPDGTPCFFVPKKKGGGTRPTNVRDARENGWLPSPTTILNILAKPALERWKINQAVHAVVTAPDMPGEGIDAKIERVLEVEAQQDQESRIARDRGSLIHDAINTAIKVDRTMVDMVDFVMPPELAVYVSPVLAALKPIGRVVASEKVLVGDRYAGRCDCICESDMVVSVVDFKTCKNLPKKPEAWPKHRMQVGAYLGAIGNTGNKVKRGYVIYISTTEPGQILLCSIEDWQYEYRKFCLLRDYWLIVNEFPMNENKPLPF